MTWRTALLLATALHLGFQLTVSLVVYPALARVPTRSWREWHSDHSTRIVPLVGIVYGSALVACVGSLLAGATPGGWVAAAATAGAFGLTAFAAVPLHGRLEPAPDRALLRRLLLVDRGRTGFALVAMTGAVLAG